MLDVLAMTWTILNMIFLTCRHIVLQPLAPPQGFVTCSYRTQLAQTMSSSQTDTLLPTNFNFSILSAPVIGKRISEDKACQLAGGE